MPVPSGDAIARRLLMTTRQRAAATVGLLALALLLVLAFAQRVLSRLPRHDRASAARDTVMSEGYPEDAEAPRSISCPEPRQGRSIPESPDPSGAVVSGRVVDGGGRPVPGAYVALLKNGERVVSFGTLEEEKRILRTDQDGRFAFADSQHAVIGEPGRVLLVRHPLFQHAEVGIAARVRDVIVVLEAGLAIEGTVVQGMLRANVPVGSVHVVARGVGAPCVLGEQSAFAGVGAFSQSVQADAEGHFRVCGLAPGWYQLDVTEAGLVGAPAMSHDPRGNVVLGLRKRTVYAQAGESGVRVAVVPLADVLIRMVDGVTDAPLASWSASVTPPAGWVAWPEDPVNTHQIVIVNGQTISTRRESLGPGCARFLMIPDRWPLPEHDVEVQVKSRGYVSERVFVPARAVGGPTVGAPFEVRMRPEVRTARVRFRLLDRLDQPVGPVGAGVELRNAEDARAYLYVTFDERGLSDTVGIPSGEYVDGGSSTVRVEGLFTVSPGVVADIPVRLVAAGVRVEALDQHGSALDDVGLRLGPGDAPVTQRAERVAESVVLSGVYLLRPGLGAFDRRVLLVPSVSFALAGARPLAVQGAGDLGHRSCGVFTLEAVRHGYEPLRGRLDLVEGQVSDVTLRFQVQSNKTAPWMGSE